ncbi:MAG TPA: hypothetical protein DD417_17235 [Elusimicrobia bacterium]|nr:hypothetical protein [Elusimicrobiota bacterium]
MNGALRRLITDISSGTEAKARRAEAKLKKLKSPECIEPLLPCLLGWSGFPSISADSAINVISSMGENNLVCNFLLKQLRVGNETVRANAAWALKMAPQSKAIPNLKRYARNDRNEEVRIWCLHALKVMAWRIPGLGKGIFGILIKAVKDRSAGIRCAAFECISHLHDPRCVPLLERALEDEDDSISKVHGPSWIRHAKKAHGGIVKPRKGCDKPI